MDQSSVLDTQATSQRGWTLPKLEELHAKSKALESSGFTTVHSPKLRASSRSALTQVLIHPLRLLPVTPWEGHLAMGIADFAYLACRVSCSFRLTVMHTLAMHVPLSCSQVVDAFVPK